MTTLTVGALTKASCATHGNAMSTKSMSFFTVRLLFGRVTKLVANRLFFDGRFVVSR